MTENDSSVFYCYRCGNRVKRAAGNCWYCGAPNRRAVRAPRHCPFCGEEIAQKAVKCPHCTEFLDGRARTEPQPAAPAQHVTFVIDKAVIHGEQPLMLPGGQPIPPELAPLLSSRTAQAIESNRPALIDQSGIKALPPARPKAADADAGTILDAETASPSSSAAEPAPPHSRALVRPETDGVPAAPLLKKTGSALAKIADRVLGAMEGKETPPALEPDQKNGREAVVDAEEVEKFKICPICGTEVLAEDNYCFHCGAVLRKFEPHRKKPMKTFGDFPFAILALCTLLLGGLIYLLFTGNRLLAGFALGGFALRDVLAAFFSGFCLILLAFAFFARRTALSQIVVVVYLVIWALASLAALITSSLS